MRELTFLGFLTEYVRSLSKAGTASVFALAKKASSDNPRLREPLLLYTLASGKKDILLRAAKKFGLEEFYAPTFTSSSSVDFSWHTGDWTEYVSSSYCALLISMALDKFASSSTYDMSKLGFNNYNY